MQEFQISGPDWLGTERFDLAAKMPGRTGRGERSIMLRNLLAERFGLNIHHVTREMTGFALTPARGGVKFKPSVSPNGTGIDTTNFHLQASGISMEDLAKALAAELERPVADETKLVGQFDLTLKWTPDNGKSDSDAVAAGSIFTAVQEQLGLRLEAKKIPVDVVVVDHIERVPTDN